MPNELHRPLQVLVVDSDNDTRDMLATLLEWRGYGVYIAASGTTALEVMRHHAVSVALVSLVLSDISGYDLVEIASAELGAWVPVFLAVSCYCHPPDRVRATEAGFRGHVKKPLNAAALFHAIDAVR